MQKYNTVFLGLIYSKTEEKILLNDSKTGLQGAANTFQWALINGLKDLLSDDLDVLSSLPVGTFPRYYKKLIIPDTKDSVVQNYKQMGFVNIPIIKQLGRKSKVISELSKKINENMTDKFVVICYSLYAPYVEALYALKLKYPDKLRICMIVPDLPGKFGIAPKQFIKKIAYSLSGRKVFTICNKFDYYVILTEQMKYPLKIEDKPYVVIEGIASYSPEKESGYLEKRSKDKTILFTGTINRVFGIERLIKAFELLKGSDYKLVICGTGDMEETVREKAKEDSRIHFLGYIKKEEVILLQKKASVLVNPRIEDGDYVKYSFPSKTIEYLLSGTPVVMDKLSGIPQDYYNYILCPKDQSPEALADTMKYACNLSDEERAILGQKGRTFIIENKTAIIQAQKIVNMIWN